MVWKTFTKGSTPGSPFLLETRRQALIEVAGGRVEGAVERPREGLERVAVLIPDGLAHVDDVEPGGGIDLEAHLDGPIGHGRN